MKSNLNKGPVNLGDSLVKLKVNIKNWAFEVKPKPVPALQTKNVQELGLCILAAVGCSGRFSGKAIASSLGSIPSCNVKE